MASINPVSETTGDQVTNNYSSILLCVNFKV